MKRNRMLPDSAAYVAVVPDSARQARRQFTRDESRRVMRRVRDILDRSTPGASDPANANRSPGGAENAPPTPTAPKHFFLVPQRTPNSMKTNPPPPAPPPQQPLTPFP